jgi:hypothetical protein
MAEKINLAGWKEKGFGDSDAVLMGSVYQAMEEPSLALLLILLEFCAKMRCPGVALGSRAMGTRASVKNAAGSRSEKHPPRGEKFERNG